MAVRREDLERHPDATVYRFPTGIVRAAAGRERMLQRRRRAGLVLVALAVVATTLLGGGSSIASRPGAPAAITVEQGDTLWEVAVRFAPAGVDRRAYVDAVIELNGLDGVLEAGRRLRLPH